MCAPVDRIKHLRSPHSGWRRCLHMVFSGSFLLGELYTFYFFSSVTLQSWHQPRIVSKSCKWMQLKYCLSWCGVQMEPYWVERFVCLVRKVRIRLHFITLNDTGMLLLNWWKKCRNGKIIMFFPSNYLNVFFIFFLFVGLVCLIISVSSITLWRRCLLSTCKTLGHRTQLKF